MREPGAPCGTTPGGVTLDPNDRYAPPVAELDLAARSSAEEASEIECRYSFRIGVLELGVAALLLGASRLIEGSAQELEGGAILAACVGLYRFVDRRVRLRVGPGGIRYASWGRRAVPWSEIRDFRLMRHGMFWTLGILPWNEAEFARRLPWLARLRARLAQADGLLRYSIRLRSLDVAPGDLVACFERHVERRPSAPQHVSHVEDATLGGSFESVVLPIRLLVWPERCLGCGAVPTGSAALRVSRRFGLGTVSLHLPCCSRCRLRRHALELGLALFAWGVGGGLAILAVRQTVAAPGLPIWTLWLWVALGVVVGIAILRRLRREADTRVWSVEAVRLLADNDRVELRFPTSHLAREMMERARIHE